MSQHKTTHNTAFKETDYSRKNRSKIFNEVEEPYIQSDVRNQNWFRTDDFESICEALESSTRFEEVGSSIDSRETASYSADGIRVDLMPDYASDTSIFRTTVVDRDAPGFQGSVEAYISAMGESNDIDSEFVDEVSQDIFRSEYQVGKDEGRKAIPIGGFPSYFERSERVDGFGKLS